MISNENIQVIEPAPGALVASPLPVLGVVRGPWYFEGSFPVELLDANRNSVATTHAETPGEWMTEDFVSFAAMVEFTPPATDTGFVVLKKDNPSGLPEHDAQVEIPVRFR
jgi:hypothetical protein